MAVSGGEGLSSAHPWATLPPRERSSAAHPKVGLSPGGGLSAAQPRGGLSPRGLSSAAVPARAAAPGVRGAADSLEPRAEPRWRRVVPREAWRGVTGGPRGMWSGEAALSSGESRQVCAGERGGERGEERCEAPLASSGGTSAADAAAAAAAAAMGEKVELVGCTQALRVSYEGERGRLGATAHATGGGGTRQEAPRPRGGGV